MSLMRFFKATARKATEGKLMQTVKVEVFGTDSSEGIERWQNYGLASRPADGTQALVLHAGGHRVVVVLDDVEKRPKNLKTGEVVLWHREGHQIHLKDGKVIQFDADLLVFNSDIEHNGNTQQNGSHTSTGDQIAGGVSQINHDHGGIARGDARTDPP